MFAGIRRFLRSEAGMSNIVAFALILPLILYVGYSGIMNGHTGDVKETMETAASVAARDYASGGTVAHAQALAYEVVSGSLPVNSGQYNQVVDAQVSVISVNGTEYAEAVVDYHYPVPIPDLPELLGGQVMGSTETVYGSAEFPVGA